MSLVTRLEATTQKYHDKELRNATKTRSYLFAKLYGKARELYDGRSYTWPVRYGKKAMQWLGEYETQNATPMEQITQAEVNYRFSSIAAVLSEQELRKNQGKARILNLLSQKMKILREDVMDSMASALWDGNDDNATGPIGIDIWVNSNGTSDTTEVAGITRGTDDTDSNVSGTEYDYWWCNKELACGSFTLDKVKQLALDCTHGSDSPDTYVTTKTVFRYAYGLATDIQRLGSESAAKLGFKSLNIDGIPLVWDDDCDTGCLYEFNLKDWELLFLKGSKMDRRPWFKPEFQRALVTFIINDFATACHNPRNQGVLTGITA